MKRERRHPGLGRSVFGIASGLLFVFLGLWVAIPVFGLLGYLWTLGAVCVTIAHVVNAVARAAAVPKPEKVFTVDEEEYRRWEEESGVAEPEPEPIRPPSAPPPLVCAPQAAPSPLREPEGWKNPWAPPTPETTPALRAPSNPSAITPEEREERLTELRRLYHKRLITMEDYEQKRRQILESL